MSRHQRLNETQIVELFDPPTEQRELVRHDMLSETDLTAIKRCRGDHYRFGHARVRCYLRYPGRALSHAIAAQLVGHDYPRLVLQSRHEPFEETLCRIGIAPGLNENIADNAILINSSPKVVLFVLDPGENLVHVPHVAGLWLPASQATSETGRELLAPASHCLVGDRDTPVPPGSTRHRARLG